MKKSPYLIAIAVILDSAAAVALSTQTTRPDSAIHTSIEFLQDFTCRYGTGVRLGITELMGSSAGGARILTEHSAFSLAGGVHLMNPSQSCANSGDCDALCGPLGDPVLHCRCVNAQCVSEHASKVASRMMAYNRCIDPSIITTAGFDDLTNRQGFSEFVLALGDPTSPASNCVEGPHMAANATLYVANNLPPPAAVVTVDQVNQMYDWFVNNSVFIVTESWGFDINLTNHAVLVDYYARKHGITFVQAAGRPLAPRSQTPVFCQGLNSVCVGGIDPLAPATAASKWWSRNGGTGSRGSAFELSNVAAHNHTRASQGIASKPDLVSATSGVDVAGWARLANRNRQNDLPYVEVDTTLGIEKVDQWVKDSGTSFSAPVVAGALGLHVENCTGGVPPPHVLKARLRTGAHGRLVAWEKESGLIQSGTWDPVCPVPPSNTFYPTVADRCDYRAGSGPISVGALMSGGDDSYPNCPITRVCGGSGGGPPVPTPIGKLCEADQPAPDSLGPSERDIVCGGATEEDILFIATDDDLPIPSSELPPGTPDGANRRARRVGPTYAAPNGFITRATWVYYSCPPQTPTEIQEDAVADPRRGELGRRRTDLSVEVDFDLLLVARNGPSQPWSLLAQSASPEEVAEGFHYETNTGYAEVEHWITAPTNFVPCSGKFNPTGVPGEPGAANIRFWTR